MGRLTKAAGRRFADSQSTGVRNHSGGCDRKSEEKIYSKAESCIIIHCAISEEFLNSICVDRYVRETIQRWNNCPSGVKL